MAEPSAENFKAVLHEVAGVASDKSQLRKTLARMNNFIKSAVNASEKALDASVLYLGNEEWKNDYQPNEHAERLFIAAGFSKTTVNDKPALALKDASKDVARSAREHITTYLLAAGGKPKPKPLPKPAVSEEETTLSLLQKLMARFGLGQNANSDLKPAQAETPPPTVQELAKMIASGEKKNIIVMCGAGISVASGIPDFRTPGSGLYDNLQKYNLPYPEAIFELNFFQKNPKPFFTLAKELYPGNYLPTPVHFFIRLLAEKGVLLRCYTQNIDTLERQAGIQGDILVEAHGSFATAHGIGPAKKEYSQEYVKEKVFKDEIPCCTVDGSLIKPDIVFFGEGLPERFHKLVPQDFKKCDLLIVIGTSLKVNPFASLIEHVSRDTPRLLINWESVGEALPGLFGLSRGFLFGRPENYRDVRLLGDCQDRIRELVHDIGWDKEFNKLLAENKYADLKRDDVVKAALKKKEEEASEDPKDPQETVEVQGEAPKSGESENQVQNEAQNQEEKKATSEKEGEVKAPPTDLQEMVPGSEKQEEEQKKQPEQPSDENSVVQADQQQDEKTKSELSTTGQARSDPEVKNEASGQEKAIETPQNASEEVKSEKAAEDQKKKEAN